MSLDTVDVRDAGNEVSVLTLNRSHRLNTLTRAMVTDLFAPLDAIDADDACQVASR